MLVFILQLARICYKLGLLWGALFLSQDKILPANPTTLHWLTIFSAMRKVLTQLLNPINSAFYII